MNNVVLLFHSTDDRDLLSLKDLGNVRPELLETALRGLRKEFDIVGLGELIENISRPGKKKGRLLAVTFDDGARSYLTQALPVLESLGIPSTCFLITDCVGDRKLYWRYLYNYCLHAGHGRELALLIGDTYGTQVREDQVISFTRRHFRPEKNEAVMAGIFRQVIAEEQYREKEQGLFLSLADLQLLRRHPLVSLGVHTKSHPVLSGLDDKQIREEISGSIDFHKQRIGGGLPMFSIPFGRLYRDYDERSVSIARELSVGVILSAYGGDNREGQPLYNVRRIPVQEEILKEGFPSFMTFLKNRCSSDDYLDAEARLCSVVEGHCFRERMQP
jgi:peptidoglycan/xylan/chitin deacetylase (PgdA/CDA1 family)